jgi:hypothetical protein
MEDAGRAIDMFNGYSWQTRILEVRLDRIPHEFDSPPNTAAPPATTISPFSMSAVSVNPYTIKSLSIGPTPPIPDEFEYHSIFAVDPSIGSRRTLCVENVSTVTLLTYMHTF